MNMDDIEELRREARFFHEKADGLEAQADHETRVLVAGILRGHGSLGTYDHGLHIGLIRCPDAINPSGHCVYAILDQAMDDCLFCHMPADRK